MAAPVVPRTLVCPKCGATTQEETTFPWFVRFGVAGCMNGHDFVYYHLKETAHGDHLPFADRRVPPSRPL